MSSLARLLGLAVVLLLIFVTAALFAQTWLQRQHTHVQSEAIDTRKRQFQAAEKTTEQISSEWSSARIQTIGQLIDAEIRLIPVREPPPAPTKGHISFLQVLSKPIEGSPRLAIVEFKIPAATRLSIVHSRTWAMLLLLALTIIIVFVIAGLYLPRRTASSGSLPPWSSSRAEMSSWENLARTSAAQGVALAHERDSRQRVEKDLTLTQSLHTQALEERVRLGRDLHDDIIQSLYAVGLTIEAVRSLLRRDAEKADEQLQRCLDNLNRTIHSVRSYITGLSPEKLQRLSFASAVALFFKELRADHGIELDLVIDEEAAAALSSEQTTEALQVTREAISNALRHGYARAITVRLHRSDTEVGLLIRDDGRGFDSRKIDGSGHGLGNMQARAAQVGASLRIDSLPKAGTRVVMTFPVINVI